MEYVLFVAPVTAEQLTKSVRSTPNLELFIEDKYFDTRVRDFLGRLDRGDAFLFDIDLFQREVDPSALDRFLKSSIEKASQIAEDCVRNLESKPVSEK